MIYKLQVTFQRLNEETFKVVGSAIVESRGFSLWNDTRIISQAEIRLVLSEWQGKIDELNKEDE